MSGIRPGKNLRVKPYALGSSSTIGGAGSDRSSDIGLDVKYGLTSGLTWDFTANTDFSQVEADEQQINLSRFSLLFPEKRDFFLENSGIFVFGGGAVPAAAVAVAAAAEEVAAAELAAARMLHRTCVCSSAATSVCRRPATRSPFSRARG